MNIKVKHILLPVIVISWFITIIGSIVMTQSYGAAQSSEGIITQLHLEGTMPSMWSVISNTLMITLAAIILSLTVNKYNIVKNRTFTTFSFFLLLQFSLPALINNCTPANINLLLIAIVTPLLFSSFQRNRAIEKSFIIALLFSIVSLFNSRILFLLPIYALGLVQMQSASVRTFAAMLIGVITPYWIIAGAGLITPITYHIDTFAIQQMSPLPYLETTTVVTIMALGFISGSGNLLLALNENIQVRVKNGFINILSVSTALLIMVDSAHYLTYLPILNYCVTLQACYLFVSRQSKISNIILYTLISLIVAWQLYLYML